MFTKRFILGFLSSALFAVGFARAATALDPVTQSLGNPSIAVTKSTPDTSTDTWIVAKSAPDTSTDTWIVAKSAPDTSTDTWIIENGR